MGKQEIEEIKAANACLNAGRITRKEYEEIKREQIKKLNNKHVYGCAMKEAINGH